MVKDQAGKHDTWLPIFYIILAVLMIGTMSPVNKFLLREARFEPLELAFSRALMGFLVLLPITMFWAKEELLVLKWRDFGRLSLVGLLGVGVHYGLAIWALQYTSVTHAILIYCMNPSVTAILSFFIKKERASVMKIMGIILSFSGCMLAITKGFQDTTADVKIGDLIALVNMLFVSIYMLLSANIVKQYGPRASNTVMFGSSALLLLVGMMIWTEPPPGDLTVLSGFLIVYLGVVTAVAYILRYLALASLPPSTVGAFHNLVPISAILLAAVLLNEPLGLQTIIGGMTILGGVELVRRG
jgi:drug/metabolite transporter (DMT)-like permease